MARRALLVAQGAAIGLVVLLLALLVWRLVSGNGGALAASVARGDHPKAPNFTAARIDRSGALSLSSFRGRPVLVNFFASWCIPACSLDAPSIEQAWHDYHHSGLVVVGVDWKDLRSDARHFMTRFDLNFPVVEDGSGSIGHRYGITGLPETYLVDRNGRVVDAFIGAINTSSDRARLRHAVENVLRQ